MSKIKFREVSMAKFKDKKSEERIFKIFGFMQPYVHTIHKNEFCSRQKYPRLLDMPPSSVSQAGHNYSIYSGIEATFHTVFQFF